MENLTYETQPDGSVSCFYKKFLIFIIVNQTNPKTFWIKEATPLVCACIKAKVKHNSLLTGITRKWGETIEELKNTIEKDAMPLIKDIMDEHIKTYKPKKK